MLSTLTIASVLIYLAARVSDTVDDVELARRIRRGDQGAFKQFFDCYHGILIGYLRRRGIDDESAADIVQNAFVTIWEKRAQIDESKSLRAFLFRIGYTRALNHFRDNAKFDQNVELSTRAAPEIDVYGTAIDFETMRGRLKQAIASLPERRRAVFEMCFLEELTYRETAEMLNISIKTVENQMAYALKSIRAAMRHFR